MTARLSGIVIDANDLDRLAEFWSGLLGLPITRREPDWISLGRQLEFQRVPEPRSGKNRIHLDVAADDFDATAAHAVALGATPAGPMREDLWQVSRDLEGNEFCLCRS